MKNNTPAHFTVFKKEAANLHQMTRSARFSYESHPNIFSCVMRKLELKQEIASVIVNGVEQTQPGVLCEAFTSYFSSTFRRRQWPYKILRCPKLPTEVSTVRQIKKARCCNDAVCFVGKGKEEILWQRSESCVCCVERVHVYMVVDNVKSR